MFEDISAFSIDVHITPCTNHCRHCWTQGSAHHRRVPIERVFFVLERLAEIRQHIPQGGFFLYDEPTAHPQFIDIVEKAAELGLICEGFFLPTNGSILAKSPEMVWQRLKSAGVDCLQLTVYGLEQTHDAFAGRRGAFQGVVTTIRRAMEYDIQWYAGVILHADDVDELEATISYLAGLDPSGQARVGWYPFSWQGRGRDAKRVRAHEYARLPESLRQRKAAFFEEREAVDRILTIPELAQRSADTDLCEALVFQVDRDLKVFCGGACDSGGIIGAVPELAEAFLLGELDQTGFLSLLAAYQQRPPRGIGLLREITWGELAERYGDRANNEMYWLDDLPSHKWAAAYLRENLGALDKT